MKIVWALVFLFAALMLPGGAAAQRIYTDEQSEITDENGIPQPDGEYRRTTWGRDSSHNDKEIPIGVFQWKIDERLGTVLPTESDTIPHHFQNFNRTEGYTGQYNILGNLGSPRLSRLFMDREPFDEIIFFTPYDYAYTRLKDFIFSNTKSPITNLSYHSCGNRQDGEDRVRAYFATNINKRAGLGFKLDYLYGRGYYNNQASALFNGSLYGYYRGDRYDMHAWISANHFKLAENGGIEDDRYITDPESFGQSFGSRDIPTVLAQTWNRNDDQTYYLTHRYNMGIYRDAEVADSLRPVMPADSILLKSLKDSIRTVVMTDTLRLRLTLDSLRDRFRTDNPMPQEFLPVTSFVHTLNIRNARHTFYTYDIPEHYYTTRYYGDMGSARDRSNTITIKNTLGIALREGFNKWAKAGLTAFVSHEYRQYSLPMLYGGYLGTKYYQENDVCIGGELSKQQGNLLHYNVVGEVGVAGDNIGDFSVEGNGDLNFRLRRDTVQLAVNAYIKNEKPGFYFENFHSKFAWWDTELDYEWRTRIEGSLSLQRTRTRLRVGFENVMNYTYFANRKTPYTAGELSGFSNEVTVRQNSGSLQVFSAILNQNFKFGIFHWDNEIAYQKSTDETVLPLPTLSAYSNLYIVFRIAKVLRVEFGGDVRYFTSYYAPDYSPVIGQFASQDVQDRVKIGNYPICNVYLNFHLKHCRFYAAVNHVNAGTGNAFWAPHYPINPLTIHFGLSWNFFN
ncbi:MAG: putative porin [Clostridium sp.]|nr:putative porin [Clostridium sp.]